MEQDSIDRTIVDWLQVRPDLDPTPLHVVGRILVLAKHLERSVDHALAPLEMNLGMFDILATLRRLGSETGLTPKQLLHNVVLTSGGMSARLDRLEEKGWIQRQPDPNDRRGVVVCLTESGRKRIDHATEIRFQEANKSTSTLSHEAKNQLTETLRLLLRNEEKRIK